MKLYLNDLSCTFPDKDINDNFGAIKKFFELIGFLNYHFSIDKIYISCRFSALMVCDTRLGDCRIQKIPDFDHRNLIWQLKNHFNEDSDLDRQLVFNHNASKKDSILLGNAHEYDCPAISFTFCQDFAIPEIEGTKNKKAAKVRNLYDKSQEFEFSHIVSSKDCKGIDPTENPLWNTEATKTYHNRIKEDLEYIKKNPEIKIPVLEKYAHKIALLNGWEKDETLTKLNKTDKVYRRIYRAEKFGKTAYLSVDFEKVEIHYELHDKRGRHLGEYRYDGTLNNKPDGSGKHDIKVK